MIGLHEINLCNWVSFAVNLSFGRFTSCKLPSGSTFSSDNDFQSSYCKHNTSFIYSLFSVKINIYSYHKWVKLSMHNILCSGMSWVASGPAVIPWICVFPQQIGATWLLLDAPRVCSAVRGMAIFTSGEKQGHGFKIIYDFIMSLPLLDYIFSEKFDFQP